MMSFSQNPNFNKWVAIIILVSGALPLMAGFQNCSGAQFGASSSPAASTSVASGTTAGGVAPTTSNANSQLTTIWVVEIIPLSTSKLSLPAGTYTGASLHSFVNTAMAAINAGTGSFNTIQVFTGPDGTQEVNISPWTVEDLLGSNVKLGSAAAQYGVGGTWPTGSLVGAASNAIVTCSDN